MVRRQTLRDHGRRGVGCGSGLRGVELLRRAEAALVVEREPRLRCGGLVQVGADAQRRAALRRHDARGVRAAPTADERPCEFAGRRLRASAAAERAAGGDPYHTGTGLVGRLLEVTDERHGLGLGLPARNRRQHGQGFGHGAGESHAPNGGLRGAGRHGAAALRQSRAKLCRACRAVPAPPRARSFRHCPAGHLVHQQAARFHEADAR
mmetsp:Transcript_105084/g.307065  ORF Transcript_105084/g.307065 Transcript_105084/m.307065 type:complete len:208 (-) Transcript_105084:1323-1946(-)